MSNNLENAPLFSLFWENSKFNKRTIFKLGKQLSEDSRTIQNISQFFYSTDDLKLSKPADKLAKAMALRSSSRAFSDVPLDEKQLGSLFSAFSQKDATARVLPSAGGKYPIEVFAFLFNIKSKLNKKIVYYNADSHSLSIIGECLSWNEYKDGFGLELDSNPAIFFVFSALAERTIKKYGERGGRFILIEAGHYSQNLALRIVQERLGGVISGALRDDEVKKHLGLEKTNCLITLGFACGNIN
jgi:SagB-type dehydrogenase family enzyme